MKVGRWLSLISVAALLVAMGCSKSAAPSAAAEAGTGASSGEDVAVTLQQWSITPTVTAAPAGSVTFNVSNSGTVPHEFVVMSTDTAAADFTISSFEGEADRFNEDTEGTNVGETGDLEPDTTKTVTIDLAAGHYAFVCNLPAHYGLGMHVDFTVT
jgi:uncharacterized cupredoxin-like copper-binding protein